MAYKYIAVTNSTPKNSSDLLRIDESGVIEQYDTKIKNWREADSEMYGIYSGDIECESISKAEAEEIIEMWLKNVD